MTGNRAPLTSAARLINALRKDTPLTVGGRAPVADSALSRSRGTARARQGFGTAGVSLPSNRHHRRDVLKVAGAVPASSYTLTFAPVDPDYWPSVYVDGLNQPPTTGWTIVGHTLTFAGGYGLRTEHVLHVEYDYEDETVAAVKPSVIGVGRSNRSPDTTSSVSSAMSPGATSGDLLLAIVGRSGTFTTPTGWTFLAGISATPGLDAGQHGPQIVRVYYRISDGSSAAVTWTTTNPHNHGAFILALRGVDQAAPIAAQASSFVVGTGTPYSPPQVEVAADGQRLIYLVARDGVGGINSNQDVIEVPSPLIQVANHNLNAGQFTYVAATETASLGTSAQRTFIDPTPGQAENSLWAGFTISVKKGL